MIFSSLFGGGSGRGPVLEPMQADDVRQVLSLIEEHDEDDAEEAEERFRDSLDGMFVLKEGPRVVGVTGAWRDPGVADVFWLSWTYLAEDKKGHGLGQAMIDQLGEMLMGEGCRKVFISTSDYVDEDGDDVYAEARAFYEGAMGASLEIRIDNYFDVGEAQLIYSAHFGAPDGAEEADEDADAEPMGPVIFDGLAQAPETDDGLALTWRALEAGDAVPDGDLVPLLAEARGRGARFVIASAPTDLVNAAAPRLAASGFAHLGRLADYDRKGVHREIWRLDL